MNIAILVAVIFLLVVGVGVFYGAPFLPTRRIWARQAILLAKVSSDDTVVDLGSGNGVVLDEACRVGAKAVGYEINPLLVLFSRFKLAKWRNQAVVYDRDFFKIDLPTEATVIYLFGVGRMMPKVAQYIHVQRNNLSAEKVRLVSFGFDVPGLKLDKTRDGMNLYII